MGWLGAINESPAVCRRRRLGGRGAPSRNRVGPSRTGKARRGAPPPPCDTEPRLDREEERWSLDVRREKGAAAAQQTGPAEQRRRPAGRQGGGGRQAAPRKPEEAAKPGRHCGAVQSGPQPAGRPDSEKRSLNWAGRVSCKFRVDHAWIPWRTRPMRRGFAMEQGVLCDAVLLWRCDRVVRPPAVRAAWQALAREPPCVPS